MDVIVPVTLFERIVNAACLTEEPFGISVVILLYVDDINVLSLLLVYGKYEYTDSGQCEVYQ